MHFMYPSALKPQSSVSLQKLSVLTAGSCSSSFGDCQAARPSTAKA